MKEFGERFPDESEDDEVMAVLRAFIVEFESSDEIEPESLDLVVAAFETQKEGFVPEQLLSSYGSTLIDPHRALRNRRNRTRTRKTT